MFYGLMFLVFALGADTEYPVCPNIEVRQDLIYKTPTLSFIQKITQILKSPSQYKLDCSAMVFFLPLNSLCK